MCLKFTCSQDSPREGLDVDSRIVRRTDQHRQPAHSDLTMLSGWRETGTARSMRRGVDAGMVFGRQLGKTSAPIQGLCGPEPCLPKFRAPGSAGNSCLRVFPSDGRRLPPLNVSNAIPLRHWLGTPFYWWVAKLGYWAYTGVAARPLPRLGVVHHRNPYYERFGFSVEQILDDIRITHEYFLLCS